MNRLRFFFLLLIFSLSTFSFAVDSDIPPIAAYKPEDSPYDGQFYIFGLEDEPVEISKSKASRSPYLWSPDGTKLIFYRGYETPVGVYDLLTGHTWFLEIDVYDAKLLSFSLDGEYLVYSTFDVHIDTRYWYQDEYGERWHPIVAKRIRLEPDSEPELMGIIYYVGPWGGAGTCVADDFIAYERGWDAYNDIGHTMLIETPYGVLANGSLIVWDSEGNAEKLFGVAAHKSEVSPTRTRLATISSGSSGFDIISLDTFETLHYETSVKPDTSFAWSQDEQFIYYATNEIEQNLFESINLDELSDDAYYLLEYCFHRYRSYTNTIRRLNLNDGTDTELLNAPFYAIGSIMPDPQGKYLYFTAIPDAMPEWVERILAGDCENFWMCDELFYPDLYRLNLETGDVELLLEDVIKATPNFAWEYGD